MKKKFKVRNLASKLGAGHGVNLEHCTGIAKSWLRIPEFQLADFIFATAKGNKGFTLPYFSKICRLSISLGGEH